jgi:hypothetical protein
MTTSICFSNFAAFLFQMKFSNYSTWYIFFLVTIVSASDWLVDKITDITTLTKTSSGTLLLSNKLISREFLLDPDFATIDFRDLHTTNSSILRCVKPEAVITLDGIVYNIGGVIPNTQCAYFNRTDFWKNKALDEKAFHFSTYEVGTPKAPFKYTPKRSAPADIQWPPKGIHLSVYFKAPHIAPLSHKYVTVTVNYEMYDGIPLIVKWLDVIDTGRGDIDLSFNSVEILAVNQPWYVQFNQHISQQQTDFYDFVIGHLMVIHGYMSKIINHLVMVLM